MSLSEAPNPSGGGPDDTTYNATVIDRIHAVLRAAIDMGYINDRLQTTASSSAEKMAAVQLGIWESIWEEGATLDLTAGNSKLNNNANSSMSGIMSAASGLFAQANLHLIAQGGFQRINGLMALTNSGSQDQLVVVPLPLASLAGFGLLGGTLAVRRLRAAR